MGIKGSLTFNDIETAIKNLSKSYTGRIKYTSKPSGTYYISERAIPENLTWLPHYIGDVW